MKINSVLHVITGLNDGGAESVLYRLCRADGAVRHGVVSLMGPGKYGPLLEAAGVSVTFLDMPQGRLTFSGVWRLWRLFRKERPQVVQTWMYHGDLIGGVVARMAGIRRIFWGIRHSTLEPGKSRRTTILIARLNAWLSKWIPLKIICCAEKAREVHAELGYEADKLIVIPNGYDLNRFYFNKKYREEFRADLGVSDCSILFGMVGRFDPLKDHENLLHALSLLKVKGVVFCCVLVGNNICGSNLKLAGWLDKYDLRDRVFLLGQRMDVPAVMSALDVHVLSSCGEAFPNVLAEAMACGIPCVTTDVGDARSIVGETGWVVPAINAEELAKALMSAVAEIGEKSKWISRKSQARKRVEENFSLDKMVASYHDVWF